MAGLSELITADTAKTDTVLSQATKPLPYLQIGQSLEQLNPRNISDRNKGMQILIEATQSNLQTAKLLTFDSVKNFLMQSAMDFQLKPTQMNNAREAISILTNDVKTLPPKMAEILIQDSLKSLHQLNLQYGLRLLDHNVLNNLVSIGNAITNQPLFDHHIQNLISAWLNHGHGFDFLYDFNDLSHDLMLINRLGSNSLPFTLGLLTAVAKRPDATAVDNKASDSLSRAAIELLQRQLTDLSTANHNLKIPFTNLDYLLSNFSDAVPALKLQQAVDDYYHHMRINPESQKQVAELIDKFSQQWQTVSDSSNAIKHYANTLANHRPEVLMEIETAIDSQLAQANLKAAGHPQIIQSNDKPVFTKSDDVSVTREKVTTKLTKEVIETSSKAEKLFAKIEQILITTASSPDFGRIGMAAEDAARSKTGLLAAMTTTPRLISSGLSGFMTYLYASNAGELAGYGPYLEGLFASHYAGSTLSNTATLIKPALVDNPVFEKITLARFGFLQTLDFAAIGYLNTVEDKPGRSLITAIATTGDAAALAKSLDDVVEKPIKRIYYQAVEQTLTELNVQTSKKKITRAVDAAFRGLGNATDNHKFQQSIVKNLDGLNVGLNKKTQFITTFSQNLESKLLNQIKNKWGSHFIETLVNPLKNTATWQNLMKSGPNAIALTLNLVSTMAWITYDVKQSNSQFEAANNPHLHQISTRLLGDENLAQALLEQDGFVGANAAPTIMRLLESIGVSKIDRSGYLASMSTENLHGLIHTALLMNRTLGSIPDHSAKQIDTLAGTLETPTPTGFAFVLAPVPRLPESIAGLKNYAVKHFNLQLPIEMAPKNVVM